MHVWRFALCNEHGNLRCRIHRVCIRQPVPIVPWAVQNTASVRVFMNVPLRVVQRSRHSFPVSSSGARQRRVDLVAIRTSFQCTHGVVGCDRCRHCRSTSRCRRKSFGVHRRTIRRFCSQITVHAADDASVSTTWRDGHARATECASCVPRVQNSHGLSYDRDAEHRLRSARRRRPLLCKTTIQISTQARRADFSHLRAEKSFHAQRCGCTCNGLARNGVFLIDSRSNRCRSTSRTVQLL